MYNIVDQKLNLYDYNEHYSMTTVNGLQFLMVINSIKYYAAIADIIIMLVERMLNW